MLSKEALKRKYNRGDYTVGAHTVPKFAREAAPEATTARFQTSALPAGFVENLAGLAGVTEVVTEAAAVTAGVRDWWAGTMIAETDHRGQYPDTVIVKVSSVEGIQAVLAAANEAGVPVTASAARSNVTGSALPAAGGVVLDVLALDQVLDFDEESQIITVQPGIFGDIFEQWLQDRGFTAGNWPSSFGISTVGGWVACRGAGQLSTRYGKIEDMVVGLDVVLADGTLVSTGGSPRAAVGPDLNQVFTGSEGTLGVITSISLRVHRLPDYTKALAFGFPSFAAGLDACREILQRGANPAVLRLYDELESGVQFGHGETNVLLIADEGNPVIIDAVMAVVADVCKDAVVLDQDTILETWLDTRYLTGKSAEGFKASAGFVADTLEMVAPWSKLPGIYERVVAAINAVPGTNAGSAHQSHAYVDGACLYFSLRGTVEPDERQAWYDQVWQAVNSVLIEENASISHHHGCGLLRSPYVADSLGTGFTVLADLKKALDPKGILNPGKLGL
ncbi:FAD-binding oxidoreductase [Brevibacterium moorei]|jgi:alkyldihydroxyacetonephosphate synthase|uniref:FAD-binding oxidoreductase n=1 Tax=Brevibacterium moorei TaxID=2968457 RepID=UPI00211C3A45|nr:FAD-binding oxidoreductase [Brevibacterium sp. 68QC2CO]MCQ9385461.1 FAD-binding oxidoreductase [Brevibacterium sp. 68QC2CO]